MNKSYTIFADYFQFYVWDKEVGPDAPTAYTDNDIETRIKAAPNIVVVQTARNTEVPVELELSDSKPSIPIGSWDHVAEASLELPSGHLEIHECTGGTIDQIKISPGTYRVRVYFGGLSEIASNGLSGNDYYKLVIWPSPHADTTVLKRYGEHNAS